MYLLVPGAGLEFGESMSEIRCCSFAGVGGFEGEVDDCIVVE